MMQSRQRLHRHGINADHAHHFFHEIGLLSHVRAPARHPNLAAFPSAPYGKAKAGQNGFNPAGLELKPGETAHFR